MAANTSDVQFDQPEDTSIPVWRYMDLPKLISLLSRQSLYLRRIGLLDNQFEGRPPEPNIRLAEAEEARLNADAAIEVQRVIGLGEIARALVYVNCWCAQRHESHALWRIYGGDRNGLAIRSTYERLCDALPPTCTIGEVQYLDYGAAALPPHTFLKLAMHKRREFDYEHEVRIITWGTSAGFSELNVAMARDGVDVRLHVGAAIESVVVSPFAPEWFFESVQAVVAKFQSGLPVVWSSMHGTPSSDFIPIGRPRQHVSK